MLKSISLENYKCFKEKTDIDIAPLTVLCGVNSSGKSSILKSLLMLKQSFENTVTTDSMSFNGEYVDNGSFNEILSYGSEEKNFTISDTFEIKKLNKNITKDVTDLRDLRKLYYNTQIQKFLINYSIQVISSGESFYSNKINKINIGIIAYTNNSNISSSITFEKNKGKSTYDIKVSNIPDVSGQFGSFDISSATCYFRGMTLNSIYKSSMSNDVKLFIPTIVSIFSIIPSQYQKIKYIAPLRENPKRRYITDKFVNDVGLSGENTPLLLKRIKNKDWSGIIAPNNEDNFYEVNENNIYKVNFSMLLNSWMNYLGLGEVKLDDTKSELVRVKINKSNIADVGFGVSQVLPILTEGISMSHSQTLLLEQPEIHLHPKMQMKMADFLLSLCMQNKSIIVETHSDHFINRIIRRYMEDEKNRKYIQIYFIDNDDSDTSKIEPITISEVDGAMCENENFFYQFASETSKIIDAGYKNLQKGDLMSRKYV